jgi:hypothetical protein
MSNQKHCIAGSMWVELAYLKLRRCAWFWSVHFSPHCHNLQWHCARYGNSPLTH